jgi:Txe/YoeB family toxin of Txe-Axe toxin-antitoxin module
MSPPPFYGVSPDFRMVCMGFMVETIIRRLGKIHFKDDYFQLGMALFRRSKMNMVDAESQRIEAEKVLVYLMNTERIELVGTEIRLSKQTAFGAEPVRMIGS